jgi:hypothetical protein
MSLISILLRPYPLFKDNIPIESVTLNEPSLKII